MSDPNYTPNYTSNAPMSNSDERLWMTLTNVGAILFGFLPSLIVYLVLKDRSAFIKRNAASAVNFNLTMLIGYIAGVILTVIFIGGIISFAAWVLTVIFSILAAVASNRGEDYTYPISIPFFK